MSGDDQLDELKQSEAAIEADAERDARTAEHEGIRRGIEDFAAAEDRQDPLRARRVDRNDAEEEEPTEQQLEDSGAYDRLRDPDAAGYREDITGLRRNQTMGGLQQMLAQIAMPVHVEQHPQYGWQIINSEGTGVVADVAGEAAAHFFADALNAAAEQTSEPELLPADQFLSKIQELLDDVTDLVRQRRRRLASTRRQAGSERRQL